VTSGFIEMIISCYITKDLPVVSIVIFGLNVSCQNVEFRGKEITLPTLYVLEITADLYAVIQ
tara:strand:+ start:1489 stop:1674 length:186 start_codon:yes stop_codon:yes gene_type:complete